MSKALFVKAIIDLLSDDFTYQFAQLVLEFIDFYFMCKFGAPENKFIVMFIVVYFYFFIFCWFFCFLNFFLYDNQTCTVPAITCVFKRKLRQYVNFL